MKVEDCPDAFYGESFYLFENKIRPADVGRSADEVMEAIAQRQLFSLSESFADTFQRNFTDQPKRWTDPEMNHLLKSIEIDPGKVTNTILPVSEWKEFEHPSRSLEYAPDYTPEAIEPEVVKDHSSPHRGLKEEEVAGIAAIMIVMTTAAIVYAASQEETEQTEKWYQTEQFRHICKTALVLLVNIFRVWAVFFAFFYILLNAIN